MSRSEAEAAEGFLGDNQALDFVGALEDAGDALVAPMPLDGHAPNHAEAAVDLKRTIHRAGGHFGAKRLEDGRLAADLLNEAEHGTDSTSVLITTDRKLVAAAQVELARQIALLPDQRRKAAAASLGVNGGCVLVDSIEEGAEVANAFGAEHLQLVTADNHATLQRIHTAGEVLLGQDTTFSMANFIIGCPASLPTSGFASSASGITAEAFLKRTAVAHSDDAAMRRTAASVIALADHEGFPAHANAVRIRLG